MAESSYLWTTSSAGDGASTYTRSDLSAAMKVIAACFAFEGVAAGYLNGLAGSTTGVNNARIATGGALVDGKPYANSANVDVTIPSASGGGNTRIDRVVLRADWTAQTVRVTRIAGVDAASPTAPTITQNTGVVYDILLYKATVNTAGTVTMTDERTFAIPASQVINTAAITDSAVTAAKIAAATITSGRIASATIQTSNLANDIVDDTIVGDRVPAFTRRQGGSATNWGTSGSTNRIPTAVRMQGGVVNVSVLNTATTGQATVTLPIAFSATPLVFISLSAGVLSDLTQFYVDNAAADSFIVHIVRSGTTGNVAIDVHWLAIGAE